MAAVTVLKIGVEMFGYNRTILRMMMSYPSIFPNHFSCQHHLFIVNGNGYEWKNGQLVSNDSLEINRSRNDILGNTRDTPITDEDLDTSHSICFHPTGSNVYSIPLYPWCEYAQLQHVIDGSVTPATDWCHGIISFGCRVRRWSDADYWLMVRVAYLEYGTAKSRKTELDNLHVIQDKLQQAEKICRKIIESID